MWLQNFEMCVPTIVVIDVPVSLAVLILEDYFFAGAVFATALAQLRFNELSTASTILCAQVSFCCVLVSQA
jgi:hypothetical protein